MKTLANILFMLLTLIFLPTCNSKKTIEMVELKNISDVTPSQLEKLGQQKIFFGHQSVGADIIEGIDMLAAKNPGVKIQITENKDPNLCTRSSFYHSKIGKNREPGLKISDFAETMQSGLADSVDVAFFKFCYVDIDKNTDVEKLFSDYKQTMESLKSQYPTTVFVHFTSPLREIEMGPKGFAKRALGKNTGYEDNAARMKYNQLLLDEYEGKDPVFDLAKYESTSPGGRRNFIAIKGEEYPSLCKEYSSDGGHLTKEGKVFIAEQFIIFLANL